MLAPLLFAEQARGGEGARTFLQERKNDMKKRYEAPVLTEMTVGTADVMLFSGELIVGGNDPFKSDISWDLI